jgi:hypothetical protein
VTLALKVKIPMKARPTQGSPTKAGAEARAERSVYLTERVRMPVCVCLAECQAILLYRHPQNRLDLKPGTYLELSHSPVRSLSLSLFSLFLYLSFCTSLSL